MSEFPAVGDCGQLAMERRLLQLEQENRRLRKINRALMERVESGPSNHGGAYGNFEHAVFLAEQVRERTEALNAALSELKHSNRALKAASNEAQNAHGLLRDAIESISDAFVLYDGDRRLVLANSKFSEFWRASGVQIRPGMHQQEIKVLSQRFRLIDRLYDAGRSMTGGSNTLLGDGKVFRLRSGNWLQVSERSTRDGGLVVLYKDITALIENERAARERALAKKSELLQNTLYNLSQGVVVVGPLQRLETWNQRFSELTGIPRSRLAVGVPFEALMADAEVLALTPRSTDADGKALLQSEQVLSSGRVLEIKTHPLPDGGFVNTYTDITERSRAVQALAASERRIRLITDAVPALIAYVDKELTFGFTNRAYERWYGWDREAILGRRLADILTPEQQQKLQPFIDRALAGETVTFDISESRADGDDRYVVKSYVPQCDRDGQVDGFYVLVQDITERRRTAEALRESYMHLEQRVAERTAELTEVNAMLLEAKKEAENANHSKTKFLAAASHDLLQPMNAARLFAASLLEHGLNERTRQLVESLNYSLEDVESLLGALVDISKLDAGAVKPDKTAFSARDLLGNLANEYRSLAQNAGLAFHFVPSSAVICTDSQLLARILRNLLSNAIRYTRAGRILLGCRRTAAGLSIEVWDTGIGIAAEKLQEIFEEFNRLQPDNSARDKGLGLGLAIVDKMAGILDHRIKVRSILGRGSCFAVEVPFGQVPAAPAFKSGLVAQLDQQQLLGKRVLVLDNDHAICEAMQTLLGGWGCRVLTARNVAGVQAQADELARGIDLFVVDYHLDDGVTGLEALHQLEPLAIDAPVLMITANYSNELKQQVRDLGYSLMNKPVKPAKLKAVAHHLMMPATVA
ncbi:hybrid sensor histidine kinase/response regulator [Motiliproteus sediminis]|uniref:hybrid sensor histidine kinase/response regulator n=1 Tax=Motiliproteus sediminis TaxID=1468178 RepID=UPI001FE8A0BD|nr:NahK/ErcS family hybrid sensor histidine kinase/response regulator [Motiliproteus sediminis]